MYADKHKHITTRLYDAMFSSVSIERALSSHEEATPDVIKQCYDLQNANLDFRRFREKTKEFLGVRLSLSLSLSLAHTRTYIQQIWDDHDYGTNDGDRTYKYRNESKELFLDFFNVPKDDPRRARSNGATYSSRTFKKEDGVTTKLILLDVRYHRDPWNDPKKPNMILGKEQWAWLESELLDDKELSVALIFSGFQVLPQTPFVRTAETWAREPDSKRKLLELIVKTQRRGIATLLISGDVHFSEINEEICETRDDETFLYRIAEYTSSGMTHAWRGETLNWPSPPLGPLIFMYGFDLSNAIASFFDVNMMRTRDMLFAGRNFGEIEVTQDQVLVRTVDTQGRTRFERRWRMEELRRNDAIELINEEEEEEEEDQESFKIWCAPQYYSGNVNNITIRDFEDGIGKIHLRTKEMYARVTLMLIVLMLLLIMVIVVVVVLCCCCCRDFRGERGSRNGKLKIS